MVDTQNLKALKASLVIEGFQMNIVNHVFLERYDKPRQPIKKQRHHFANKGPYSQSYVFFSSHVQM